MNKYGVTAEKIEEVLKANDAEIEVKSVDNKVYLRNKDWSNLRTVNTKNNKIETYSYRKYLTKEKEIESKYKYKFFKYAK